jgi:hypothetical protein
MAYGDRLIYGGFVAMLGLEIGMESLAAFRAPV